MMTATYDCIATTTLGSAQTTVTFSSISGSFTDLVLVIVGTNSNNSSGLLSFNSTGGTNYSQTNIYGDGSTAQSTRNPNDAFIYIGYSAPFNTSTPRNALIQIMNYANTTTNKTLLYSVSAANTGVERGVGLWRQTSAITRIDISPQFSGTWSTGSTFTLYGIKSEA